MSDLRTVPKKAITDVFVEGAKKGWAIATGSMLPNVLMAFVIILILNTTGLLDLLAIIFKPVMMLFGVPGDGMIPILTGWLSMGGGYGALLALLTEGRLSPSDAAIIAPAIILVGSQVQYLGRVLGVVGIDGKHYFTLLGVSFINAFVAMFVMTFIV